MAAAEVAAFETKGFRGAGRSAPETDLYENKNMQAQQMKTHLSFQKSRESNLIRIAQ